MQDVKLDTLCVTDEEEELTGLIAVKDIANASMSLSEPNLLSKAKTSYEKDIVSTLG